MKNLLAHAFGFMGRMDTQISAIGSYLVVVTHVHVFHSVRSTKPSNEQGVVVDRYSDSFNEHSEVLRGARAAVDRDDLQHAMSGTEVGRQRKHIQGAGGIDPATGKKRKTTAELVRETLDWLLANDQHYALLHSTAMTSLVEAEATTQRAIERASDVLNEAQAHHDVILSQAARLPDGTRVFRDSDGAVWAEDGKRVDAATAEGIAWRGDEPSYEDYLASKDQLEAAETSLNDLRGIETELGGYRGELTDQTPATAERVEAIKDRIEQINEQAASLAQDHALQTVAPTETIHTANESSASISVPIMPKK